MFDKKLKIFIVMPSLAGGGAQKVMSTLINNLDPQRFDIHVALIANDHAEYTPPDHITLYCYNYKKIRYGIWHLYGHFKQVRPDIVLSSLSYLNIFLMALRFLWPAEIKFIARESNIPSIHLKQYSYPKVAAFLYRTLYPKFDKIICQSNDMQKDLIENFSIDSNKTTLIHNPVDINAVVSGSRTDDNHFRPDKINLVAVGKLMYQKGFDLLLQAYALLQDERFFLTIIGKGGEEANLRELADRLKITDRINFGGYCPNPYPMMKEADLFILSSRYEGFPNVLLEANACGTPVVAFNCPGGINEIIVNGLNGWTVEPEDVESLAQTILMAIDTPLDAGAISSFIGNHFGLETIIPQYSNLFENIYCNETRLLN